MDTQAVIALVTALGAGAAAVLVPAWRAWLEFRQRTQDDLKQIMALVLQNQEAFKSQMHKFDVIIENQQRHLADLKAKEAPKE